MLRVTCAAFAALAGLLLGTAGSALAAPPRVIDGVQLLGGEHRFSELVIRQGATLRVPPGADPAAPALHVRAGRIVIETGGTIDATGAGYQGIDGADGGEPAGSGAAGRYPATAGHPGTGGANAGAGGPGVDASCALITSVAGGQSYPAGQILPGSAGGAAHPTSAVPSRGGHGGGVVVLEAAEIRIDGQVLARGGDGIGVLGTGSGGGGGGVIRVITAALSGSGLLAAAGGSGGTGVSRHGGGGGGGVVLLATGDGTRGSLTVQVGGGQSGPCAVTAGDGVETVEAVGSCLDVDEDGHAAAVCGGDDCDDGDPTVFPGAADDTCDGEDNDCNGAADDALSPAACPENHACQDGQCVSLGEGGGPPDAGTPGSVAPARLEYQGGCGVGVGTAPVRRSAAPGLLGLWLMGALAWRRRVVARAKVS